MKSRYAAALVLTWILVLPASRETNNFRIEHCCYPTQAACEAALKKAKRVGTCEVQMKLRPNDNHTLSSLN